MDGMDKNIQNENNFSNSTPVMNSEVVTNEAPVMNSGVVTNEAPIMNNETIMYNNVSGVNMNSNNKKKSNTAVIIGVVVAVLLIAIIGGLFAFKHYVGRPLTLYKGAIKEVYEDLSGTLKEVLEAEKFNFNEDTIVMDGSLKLSSNIPGMEEYTKYDYGFNLGLDVKNKKMEMGASMNENSKEVIGAIFYILDKTMYIKSDQAYDKPLYGLLEENLFGEFVSDEGLDLPLTYEEIDKLLEKLSNYLSNALNEKNFKEESTTITVNGKEVKVTKVIYTLNQDILYEMCLSMLEDMKTDDEFIGLVAKLFEMEKSEVKESLTEIKLNKDDFKMDVDVEFHLYTKGFFPKVIGYGYYSEGFEEESSNEDGYSYTIVPEMAVTFVEIDDNAEFNFKIEDVEFIASTVGTKTNGSLKAEGEDILSFTLIAEEKEKNNKFDLTITISEADNKVILNLVSDVTEESDKKAKGVFDVKIKITEGAETVELGAKLNINTEIGGKVEGFDTTGAVDLNTLTDVEIEKIQTNLITAIENTFLYDLLFVEDDYYEEDEYYDEYFDDSYYDDEYNNI